MMTEGRLRFNLIRKTLLGAWKYISHEWASWHHVSHPQWYVQCKNPFCRGWSLYWVITDRDSKKLWDSLQRNTKDDLVDVDDSSISLASPGEANHRKDEETRDSNTKPADPSSVNQYLLSHSMALTWDLQFEGRSTQQTSLRTIW